VSDEEWADEFDLVAKAVGILNKLAVGVAPQMTPANICGVVQSIWRLESSLSSELSEALMEQAIKSIKGFEPRHVSNLPFLMSQLGVRPRLDLLEALVLQADAKVESFKAIDASRFLTALANLQHVPDQGFVDRFLSVLERQLTHLKASEVGFVYWSLGSLGICPPQVRCTKTYARRISLYCPPLDSLSLSLSLSLSPSLPLSLSPNIESDLSLHGSNHESRSISASHSQHSKP
jgi:hypothetical protein